MARMTAERLTERTGLQPKDIKIVSFDEQDSPASIVLQIPAAISEKDIEHSLGHALSTSRVNTELYGYQFLSADSFLEHQIDNREHVVQVQRGRRLLGRSYVMC